MSCAFRCLLVLMALLVTATGASAGKGNPPAAHKPPPPKPAMPKPPHLPKPPLPKPPPPRVVVPHPAHVVPRHASPPMVTHHARPIVHRNLAPIVHRSPNRVVVQPVRRTLIRTIHRYPVRRVPYRFVRRWYYPGFFGYGSAHYRGRYWWRNHYYLGNYGHRHRRRHHVFGGIVESVQGNLGNGILLVKVFRPRSSRFRWVNRVSTAGSAATSLNRFLLNNGTAFEVMTNPPRLGTIADLHKGAHVLIRPHASLANTAQRVQVSPGFRR